MYYTLCASPCDCLVGRYAHITQQQDQPPPGQAQPPPGQAQPPPGQAARAVVPVYREWVRQFFLEIFFFNSFAF